MNKKGMPLFCAMNGVSDEMLLDALPPDMDAYAKKQKSRPMTGFFERPWVAAVISAAVALVVLTGIIWAGQKAAKDPMDPSEGIAGNPANTENGLLETDSNIHDDTWPDYDNPPVPEDAKLVITSCGYTIAPQEYFIWKDVWNSDKGKMEEVRGSEQWATYFEEADSGADTGERREILQNLPRIPFQSGNFSAEMLHPTLQFYAASAYDDDLRHAYSASLDQNFDSAWTLEELLEQLAPGSYCILVIAYDKGNYVEAAGDYEDAMYEFLFIVDVYDSGETQLPIEPPIELPEIQEAMGMELWVGDRNDTYQQLKPYVTSAYLYKDEEGVWADVGGHGVDNYDPVNFPALNYAPGFTVFFKPVDKIQREAFFERMTIYYGDDFLLYETYHDVTDDLWQLAQLKPGTYLVTFIAHHKGREIDGQLEEGTYEYAFKLIVNGEGSSETHEEETEYTPSFPDLAPSDSIDIELYVRSDVDAPQKLTPHVVYAYLYEDDTEQYIEIRGAGLNQRISELYDTLPIFTFDETIEWYLENKEDEASCQWYGTDLYDEQFNRVSDVEDIDPEELGPGKYYAVIGYYQAGREITNYEYGIPAGNGYVADMAEVTQEYGYYEYGFCIVIPEP